MVSIDQYLYRFVGVLVNLAFSFLFFNSLLVYMYFIPMNVRCSVVSFCAGCVGALSQFTILPIAMKLKHDYGNKSYLFIYAICLSFGIGFILQIRIKKQIRWQKSRRITSGNSINVDDIKKIDNINPICSVAWYIGFILC